ncbi:MAG: SulP family inorganic anion transporter [Pirellulaceae bacterium]
MTGAHPSASPTPAAASGRFPLRLLFRFVPAADSLRTYSWAALRSDTFAGVTVAAIAVPQAMAYASIFGVPVQYGLYTAIVMTAVGALLDSSRQLINGPTNAISIALLSALAIIPDEDRLAAAIFLALLIGALQTCITLLRLGDLSRYISHAVIVGFTVGASVLLVLDQSKHLFGLRSQGGDHDHFLMRFWLTWIGGGPMHGWTLTLGLGTVAAVLLLRWVGYRLHVRLPDLLLGMVGAALVVWALQLDQAGVRVVGSIPRSLPSFQWPEWHWSWLRDLTGSAMAIALLGLLEAIAMAKAIAAHTRQKLDINQQCLSEGVANMTGSFFQCFPGSGSLTRTAINHQAGAATQWSGVISALAVAVTVLFCAPLARYIPRSALSGILILSAWRMVDRDRLVYHMRATRFDAAIVAATALTAVAVSVEFCILVGTLLSFVFYVPRAARVQMTELCITPERVIRERRTADPPCLRLRMYDLEGELFFGSAPDVEQLLEQIERETVQDVRVVVLRLRRARNPDAVCLHLLDEFLARLAARGQTVLLCGIREDVAAALANVGIAARLGEERIFRESPELWSSTLEAARYAYRLLGEDLCDACPQRPSVDARGNDWYYMI